MTPIVEGAYRLALGTVNAVLLDGGTELALVDAGWPGAADRVFAAVARLGRTPRDLRHLVFTHHHPDHIGSGAEIVARSGATTYMHAADIAIAESGGPFRPMRPAAGPLQRLVHRFVWDENQRVAPVAIDHAIADGEVLPIAGGLRAIHSPGHCAGQIALLWRGDRLLIGGDVGIAILGLSDPVGFEDEAAGRASQRRLASLNFDAAIFGHGRPITRDASKRVARRWGAGPPPGRRPR